MPLVDVELRGVMADYELHDPDYSGTTTADWDAPQKEDFDTDDLGQIADHFLLSASGFPPDRFTDLKLPVVEPNGDLNENALQTAHGGAHSVEAIDDIDDETKEDAKNRIEDLAKSEFDEDIGELSGAAMPRSVVRRTPISSFVPVVRSDRVRSEPKTVTPFDAKAAACSIRFRSASTPSSTRRS